MPAGLTLRSVCQGARKTRATAGKTTAVTEATRRKFFFVSVTTLCEHVLFHYEAGRVDALVADQEITRVRLRGKLVRFILPDVVWELKRRRAREG